MNNSLEDLLADKSFVLWLRGEATAEQKEYWDNWLHDNPDRQLIVREAKNIINTIDNEHEVPDPYEELEKLNQAINQYESHQQLNRLISSYSNRGNQSYRTMTRHATAALLAIVVLLGGALSFFYINGTLSGSQELAKTQQTERYSTDYGEKITFRLSDGSRITLNGNSNLTFSTTEKNGLSTEVWLEGEAYFQITHLEGDKQRSFTVRTNDGTVSVLGTRFVVNTFRGETKTVLEEGKVTINNPGSSANYELSPGELARFKADDSTITIKEVNTQVYTSWIKDKLIFENTPMTEVAKRIENTFGVKVVLSTKLTHETLSGSIKSSNLNVLKEALEEVLHTNIKQKKEQLMIGTR
ncbi:FecR domain-containing protein [Aliifodinibius salicampi]|uniref:FecR domain-containing protein n=1 Tax=Fodinibius salicampi TaxID=1920655 RepID=A0ABT3PVN8_9BACT|nr:FecR family protein [Fodinibius salicampi]MCW9711926.1 FecR domain-containing protein [Fodinibius salicampi]